MQKQITINNSTIIYTIKKSTRSKRVRLTIDDDTHVRITVPRFVTIKRAEQFLHDKADWVIKNIEFIKKNKISLSKQYPTMDYQTHKVEAAKFIANKINHYNKFYNFKFNSIKIKNNKRIWGSCSSKKNLNFNYRLMFLEPKLADYIIVHELCHLEEMNHSKRFWALVARVFPDYKERTKGLRKIAFK